MFKHTDRINTTGGTDVLFPHHHLPQPFSRVGALSRLNHRQCTTLAPITQLIVSDLCNKPWTPAAALSAKYGLHVEALQAVYARIRRSATAQQAFASSANRDYFDIVKNHFEKKAFEVVFFVGLSCPLRCRFCPNVTVNSNGTRRLRKYPQGREAQITREEIERVFVDIRHMQASGTRVLVKISGGLEPFTHPEQIGWILGQAERHGVPSQIFTNGVLLTTRAQRALALRAGHLRISVSAHDQETFAEMCLGRQAGGERIFARLTSNIKKLIAQRNETAHATVIGINSVIGPESGQSLERLIDFAGSMGVDYLDLKPDYFHKDQCWMHDLNKKIAAIQAALPGGKINGTRVVFAGSMNINNVYHVELTGTTRVDSQCGHKVFITPFGECTPVHYGAYPQWTGAGAGKPNPYTLGRVSKSIGISALIARAGNLPEISYDLLNPYERILDLETKRRQADAAFGLAHECSPYDPGRSDQPGTVNRTDHSILHQ